MTTTKNNEHKKLNFSSEREQSQACLNSAEHEKNQGRKVLNVPNLRFKEFEGEWEKKKLEECVEFLDGLRKPIKSEDRKSEQGLYPYYGASGIIDYIDGYIFDGEYILLSEDGANIIDRNYRVAFIAKGKIWVNNHAHVLQPYDGFDINFLSETLERLNYAVYNTGTTMPKLNQEVCRNINLKIPTPKEQNKIGNLLSLLNERIATQNKIIEDLKKLKSAIIEKIFCSPNQERPICRVEGFEHPLITYKMSDFCSRIATKNKEAKCSLVLTIAAQYGLVNQESFFNKSVASENLMGYYLLHKGEFAYNRSYSAGYDWGAVKRLDRYDEGVLSTLYICFKINKTIVDSDYLAYYFESTKWHRGLSDIAGEGARNHGLLNVSITDYFNTKHRFPVIEEQKAIAKMLNAITEKERKATLLGECYQKQKQYLLRQMFI